MSDATLKSQDATIHDLGYRRYEGAMLGSGGAWRALYWQGFRAMFGMGRSMRAKIAPVFVVVITMLPALAMLTAASASQGMMPVRYAMLIGSQVLLYILFAAAQVPELLSRDQHDKLLPLVLTRQVTRRSYAVARFAAVFSAILVVVIAPSLLLYVGEIGSAANPGEAFDKMGHKIMPILVCCSLIAFLVSSVASAVAAWTPRRAFATAGIIGLFLVVAAVGRGLEDLAGLPPRVMQLVDPIRATLTFTHVMFEETTREMELNPPLPASNYIVYLLAVGMAGLSLLWWRVQRVRV